VVTKQNKDHPSHDLPHGIYNHSEVERGWVTLGRTRPIIKIIKNKNPVFTAPGRRVIIL